MGVEQLYGQWIKKIRYNGVRPKHLPKEVHGILFDSNGILHEAAQFVYAYGKHVDPAKVRINLGKTDDELQRDYEQVVGQILFGLVGQIKPSEAVAIAVDGVAPPAKLRQQKIRRFKSAKEAEGSPEPPRFDSTNITPGTPFMIHLDTFLESWVDTFVKTQSTTIKTLVYSSHLAYGEGEHKLYRLFREGVLNGRGKNYVVYGMDADLVILSLLMPEVNFYLVRENLRDIVDITALRNGIYSDMNGEMLQTPTNLGMDKFLAIQDFATMVMMIGNDFLPRIFAFHNVADAIELMIGHHRNIFAQTRTHLTTKEGTINWSFMTNLLYLLSQQESDLLAFKSTLSFTYNSPILDASTKKIELPHVPVGEKVFYEARYRVESFDFNYFRQLWYGNVLGPRTQDGIDYINDWRLEDPSIPQTVTNEDIILMARTYLYGFQWVLSYYTGAIDPKLYSSNPSASKQPLPPVAVDYIYQYTRAPLITDLYQTAMIMHQAGDKMPLNLPIRPVHIHPYHQLVAVIPPRSFKILPKVIATLVDVGGELSDISPTDFQVDFQAVYNDHQGVPILPGLDIERIIIEVNSVMTRVSKYGNEYQAFPLAIKEKEAWVINLKEKPKFTLPVMNQSAPPGLPRNVFDSSGGRGGRGGGRGGRGGGRGGGRVGDGSGAIPTSIPGISLPVTSIPGSGLSVGSVPSSTVPQGRGTKVGRPKPNGFPQINPGSISITISSPAGLPSTVQRTEAPAKGTWSTGDLM